MKLQSHIVWQAHTTGRQWYRFAPPNAQLSEYPNNVSAQIKEALRSQAAHDVAPTELSPAACYIQDDLSHEGYRHLLAVSAPLPDARCRSSCSAAQLQSPALRLAILHL